MSFHPTTPQEAQDVFELGDRVAYYFLLQSSLDTAFVVTEAFQGITD